MKLEGERLYAAPRTVVWDVLNDPRRLAQAMPGVESFDVQDETHWRAHVRVPLGLGALRMSVDFEKTEQREPELARLHAKGNGVGAVMNMQTAFHLAEADRGTRMRWEADVHILGPIASMGDRVLRPVVDRQVTDVLEALERQVDEAAATKP